MSHTHSCLSIHLVYSTRNRVDSIPPELMPRLCSYLGGIARKGGCVLLAANGMPDHIHQLLSLHPSSGIADLTRDLKANSSRWLKEQLGSRFSWLEGCGAFAVSASNIPRVRRYIENQQRHHAKMSFETEYISPLDRHNITYDRQYVFG